MATKRQRRRRDKERRHDYEYVYIDEEGNEVEVEPPPSPKERTQKTQPSPNARRPAAVRGVRAVKPPTWRFMRKQALIFFLILFGAFLIIPTKGMTPLGALFLAAIYTLALLPLLWMMQRMLYRSYLKRTGQLPPEPKRRQK